MADDIGGVWRTIGGRRVFIRTGATLSQAMKESGKFKNLGKKVKKKKYTMKEIQEMADKEGVLPSEIQDRLGITDEELKLEPDNYTKEFEEQMQSVDRYIKAEQAKSISQLREEYEKAENNYAEAKTTEERIKWNNEATRIGKELDNAREFNERGKNTISNVRFATEQFEGSHLKAPKGTGMWAFSTDREGNDIYFTPHAMSYSDAKKWIVNEMNRKGKKVYTLYVRE